MTLTPPGHNALSGPVGIDSTGKATVVWARNDGSNYRIQARAITAVGPGTTETLSAPGEDAFAPSIVVDSADTATVVWDRSDGSNTRIQARTIAADGTPGGIRTLSTAGQDASQPLVAVDSTGTAIVVWSRFDGSDRRVQARTIGAGGALGAIKTLSAPSGSAYNPRIAIDSTDKATVVWQRDTASSERIETRSIRHERDPRADPDNGGVHQCRRAAPARNRLDRQSQRRLGPWASVPHPRPGADDRPGRDARESREDADGGDPVHAVNAQVAVDSTDKVTRLGPIQRLR